jgi:Domain of unknown function (DUF4159)
MSIRTMLVLAAASGVMAATLAIAQPKSPTEKPADQDAKPADQNQPDAGEAGKRRQILPPVSADEIDASIARAIECLFKLQNGAGNWEQVDAPDPGASRHDAKGGQWGGRTALAVYALLSSGVSPNDPRMVKGIEFLKKANKDAQMMGYYALGLRSQIWLFLPPTKENKKMAEQEAKLMVAGVGRPGNKAAGLYDYTIPSVSRIDMSVSQYGVLGMWACEQLVPEIDYRGMDFWNVVDKAWKAQQEPDGGWSYDGKGGGKSTTLSMTTAGVATLFITQDYINESAGAECKGNISNKAIDSGMNWLSNRFPDLLNSDTKVDWRNYTLYGIERIGVASGFKYLSDVNWFAEGASYLVKGQNKNSGAYEGGKDDFTDTAFGLLFLSRGRAPVMMNKIRYSISNPRRASRDGDDDAGRRAIEGNWNQRPRDVANASKYTAKTTERLLNWQIIDLDVAAESDLRDAPIAFFAGSTRPGVPAIDLSQANRDKLRQYVEEGGMLVFSADCGDTKFSRSAEKLAIELLGSRAEFQPLDASHPILKNQQFPGDNWKTKPRASILTNGVRVLAMSVQDDLGRSFQLNNSLRDEPFQFMTNVYQYAIDKSNAQVKGRSHVVEPNPAIVPTRSISVARLKYSNENNAANWDPEPGAWRRLAAVFRNQHQVELKVDTVELGKGTLSEYKIAHITGAGEAVKLSDAVVAELKAFVDAGGLLIVDAAGGSVEFKNSIEPVLAKVNPEFKNRANVLPQTDSLYTVNGMAAPKFGYRTFAMKTTIGQTRAPRIRGLQVGERYGILYSSEDLTAGLLGIHVDGIVGYEPQAAVDIMTRAIFYGSSGK